MQRLTTMVAIVFSLALSAFSTTSGASDMQPARPGHFAELEELEAARKANTIAAYDLFIARHPNSRYANTAKKERMNLTKR